MIDILQQHLVSRLGADVTGLDEVLHQFKPVTVKRNEVLLREGEVCRHVYFVAKGCLQVFTIDAVGTETIRVVEPCHLSRSFFRTSYKRRL
jgi:CRP-like cAMP-binding protein